MKLIFQSGSFYVQKWLQIFVSFREVGKCYLAAKLYLMLCLPHRVSTTYNTIGHYAFLLCDGNLTSSTLAGPDFALPNVEVLKATPSVAELRYGMSPVPIILFSRLT